MRRDDLDPCALDTLGHAFGVTADIDARAACRSTAANGPHWLGMLQSSKDRAKADCR